MPNLSHSKIAATLAVLAVSSSCTKQADVSREPAKATEVQAAPPTATAAASTAPEERAKKNDEGADASVAARKAAGPAGSATGQMSCGAGKCSGEVSGKKK